MSLRPQCAKCPWLDLPTMQAEFPAVVDHARTNPDGFVCHTRCGPCDGPRHANVTELAAVS